MRTCVIEGIDASYTGGGQSGYGITVSSVSALLVNGVTVNDRGNAMQVDGSPMTITNSAFLDNGTGLSTNAASGGNIDGSNQEISNCWLSGNSTAVNNGGAELLAQGNFWGGNGEPLIWAARAIAIAERRCQQLANGVPTAWPFPSR